jgi:hypothetical protein
MMLISHDHDNHRRSLAPLLPFFSKAGITRVESRVLSRVKKLCARFEATKGSGTPVNFTCGISSLTTGTSPCYELSARLALTKRRGQI